MIDTVTFDLWNTLVCNTPKDSIRYRQIRLKGIYDAFSESDISVKYEDLEKAYDLSFEEFKKFWDKNIDMDSKEQIDIMLQNLSDLNLKRPDQKVLKKIRKAYVEPVLYDPPDLAENTKEILSYLKEKKFRIGLICNTGRTPGNVVRKLMEELDILKHFDVLSFSNELRVRKPHKKIFLYTLNELKSLSKSSFHVGDELRTDILGAKNVGMTTVFLKRKDEQCKSLDAYADIVPDHTIFNLNELRGVLLDLT